MTQEQLTDRILSKSQRIYLYLCEHRQATAAELRKATKSKNVAAAISQINDGLLASNGLPQIKRTRDSKGFAVYSVEVTQ
jgi:hypothetical protein